MARYNPTTRSNHNMYDMASLLQKAVRRGDTELAGFAAYEMYGSYHKVMWNRMMTIASEDCWGILSKELVDLRRKDEELNAGKKGYAKDAVFVSKAISLLSRAKKSRDACYFACNFIFAENPRNQMEVSPEKVERCKQHISGIPDEIFTIDALSGIPDVGPAEEQMSFMGGAPEGRGRKPRESEVTQDGRSVYEIGALLQDAIRLCDMENMGHYANILRTNHRMFLWKLLLATAVLYSGGILTQEVISLKLTDDLVNGHRASEAKDEIFMSKAMMLLCYHQFQSFGPLAANSVVDPFKLIDWNEYKIKHISRCALRDGIIPDYVYDVHTIKGKRAGKTDWGMNLVEQAALSPLQEAFFDYGSWAPRYDYKHAHNMCSDEEYRLSLEYRKTTENNPVPRLWDSVLDSEPDHSGLDELSGLIYSRMTRREGA